MKFFSLLLITLFLVACNKAENLYIYELETNGTNFFAPLNASCDKSKYDEEFKKKYCFKEDKIYKCETEERAMFGFKEFKTKSICDTEVQTVKKSQIGSVGDANPFKDNQPASSEAEAPTQSPDTIKNTKDAMNQLMQEN